MTERTMRLLIIVGVIWIVLGIVRLAFGDFLWGGIAFALGIATMLRGLAARRRGEVL